MATLYPIQYMRAFAALAVFFYHIVATQMSLAGDVRANVLEVGAAGVDLFFIISGFIMAKIVWDKPINARDFFYRRIVRVVPLYWAATLAVFTVALIVPSLLGSTKADWLQLLHSLFFIPYGANPDSSAPVLLIGWTLNYEMFFYVLVALFAGMLGDRSLMKVSALFCTLALAGLILAPANRYLQFYLDPIILEFALGIGVFHFWRSYKSAVPGWIYLVLFAGVLGAIASFHNFDPGAWRPLFWGVPAALLMLSGLHVLQFKNETLRILGDSSYSIYVLHLFVIMGYMKVLSPLLARLEIPFPPEISYLMMSGVLVLASIAVHYGFERNASRLLSPK